MADKTGAGARAGRRRITTRPTTRPTIGVKSAVRLAGQLGQEELLQEGRQEGRQEEEISLEELGFKEALESIDLEWLVDRIVYYCERQADRNLYPYQRQLAERIVESIIINDGEEVSALFSRQCIPAGQQIYMANGSSKGIENVKAGDRVLSINKYTNEVEEDMVMDCWKTGVRKRLRIKTLRGYEIECSPDHLIYTPQGWKRAGELKKENVGVIHKRSILEWDYIVQIEKIDAVLMYDIETKKNHNFICEGFVVHNSGKSETVAVIVGGIIVILPKLAQIPMFEPILGQFKEGVWVGLFAPSNEQAFTLFSRIRGRLRSKNAALILNDPEISTEINKIANPIVLSNGSIVMMQSAAKQSQIESKTYHLIVVDECQDCDRMKIQKCLTGDTKILTNKGYKRIDKIVRDKMGGIIRFDSNFNKLIEDDPIEFYDNGIQEVFNIRLNNGNEIKATKNHHFFGYRRNWKKPRWVTVEEIIKYQNTRHKIRLAVPDSLPEIKEGTEKDYYEGLLVGYFLGDGCITGSPMFAGNEETVKRLHKIINNLFGDNIKMAIRDINEKNGLWQVAYTTEGNKKNSNPITAFFREIGIYGMKGEKKHLPNHMSYSKEFYRGFIEALIETDGSVDTITIKPNISFANISETLVNEIKDILLLFGIHATKFIKYNNPIKGYSITPLHILHIKSVLDIQRFYKNFKLFSKQNKLDISMETIKNKKSKNKCQFYPDTLRFYQVTNVSPAGKEHTYCLKMRDRNFIANNIVSSNSIHPMMAATNGTIVKLGTPNTKKCEFFDAINRNKRMDATRRRGARPNHYEFNYKVCQRYNPKYRKYVEKEKRRYGEFSDSFRMSYKLEWLLERGMFLTPEMREMMEDKKLEHKLQHNGYCAVGIDVGKSKDSTVVTVLGVDWDKTSEDLVTGELRPYKEIIHWLELHGDDYESQYFSVIEFLNNYNVKCIFIDATGVGTPVADRLIYGMEGVAEVVPYNFTVASKSVLWKTLRTEIETGRLRVAAHRNTRRLRPYVKFWQQMEDLEKDWKGQHMVCHHPKDEKDAHDDFPVSLALAVMAANYDAMPEIVEEDNFIFENRRRIRK